MPLLAELDLGGVGARFMSAFTHALDRAHAQTFLPSLQTLRIGCESCEVGGELVAVLASRCDGGIGSDLLDATLVQLKSFHLVWAEEGWIDPSFMDVLSELVRRGMTIHIGKIFDYSNIDAAKIENREQNSAYRTVYFYPINDEWLGACSCKGQASTEPHATEFACILTWKDITDRDGCEIAGVESIEIMRVLHRRYFRGTRTVELVSHHLMTDNSFLEVVT
ncbi:hypothetical protein C8J57DRAFT_1257753 [Mycena rebaudengoi]|nr:hypothetical protein C8J57DRAFT_1257753 [Mycena rebaudengoi]